MADVAWAAAQYLDWTGTRFAAGPGRRLLAETARYWASRVRFDRGGEPTSMASSGRTSTTSRSTTTLSPT